MFSSIIVSVLLCGVHVADYGATPDDGTSDTSAVQRAVNAALETDGRVEFGRGIYDVRTVFISHTKPGAHPGLRIVGSSTTIRTQAASGKWVRCFSAGKGTDSVGVQHYLHNSPRNSGLLEISGLHHDGNAKNQNWRGGHDLEQQAFLFLQGGSKGKLSVSLHDLTGENGVADFVHVFSGANLMMRDCRASEYFRGGLVISGDGATVVADGIRFVGEKQKTGVDIETNDTLATVDVTLKNAVISSLEISVHAESQLAFDKVRTFGRGTYVYSKSPITFSRCEFQSRTRLRLPGPNCVFDNCTWRKNGKGNAVKIEWEHGDYNSGQRVTFQGCRFFTGDKPNKPTVWRVEADRAERNNWLIIRNCRIEGKWAWLLKRVSGGNYLARENWVRTLRHRTDNWEASSKN